MQSVTSSNDEEIDRNPFTCRRDFLHQGGLLRPLRAVPSRVTYPRDHVEDKVQNREQRGVAGRRSTLHEMAEANNGEIVQHEAEIVEQ